jgi:hypothetical protein
VLQGLFHLGGIDFRVTYQHPQQAGRGFVLLESPGRFLVAGAGFEMRP